MLPVADEKQATAEQILRRLLDRGWYVLGERTAGRRMLKPEDRLCFYRKSAGVVAEATVAGTPEQRRLEFFGHQERFPWAVRVKGVRYFFDKPVGLDPTRRGKLDAFKGRDATKPWAWFVQSARLVSEHDFGVLTGRQ